jgi:hypothetical protein
VKPFGDAVVASEAPHGEDLLSPGGKRLTELHQLRQACRLQLMDRAEEARDQGLTLLAGAMLLQQEITESLFEAVNEFQGRILCQIGHQPGRLIGAEIVAMSAHQRKQAAIPAAFRIELAPAVQKMVIDEPDDVESISHDLRIGKLRADQRAIVGSQIHAHHADFGFPFQSLKIGLQR